MKKSLFCVLAFLAVGCSDSSTPPASDDVSPPAPACRVIGQVCSETLPCCAADSNAVYGASCDAENGSAIYLCHAICYTALDCVTGDCVPVIGENYGSCI